MSASPISYVLLTGATGFIGAHVLDFLLGRGLKVRIAVRNLDKARGLKSDRPKYTHMLDVVQVGDYTTATSFAEAIKDVDGIVHVASVSTHRHLKILNLVLCEHEKADLKYPHLASKLRHQG